VTKKEMTTTTKSFQAPRDGPNVAMAQHVLLAAAAPNAGRSKTTRTPLRVNYGKKWKTILS